ncbi:hypothetical protein CDAR_248731 [Caerostris darwini]|uniref:Uncharacterized protein n=1 Tax=Caerostris darwini TaxID=1538125 RepID=A0AAV4MSY8_9ARAC|nr:hypothetical protein CDAR_248731 [Caerostris darwini]
MVDPGSISLRPASKRESIIFALRISIQIPLSPFAHSGTQGVSDETTGCKKYALDGSFLGKSGHALLPTPEVGMRRSRII